MQLHWSPYYIDVDIYICIIYIADWHVCSIKLSHSLNLENTWGTTTRHFMKTYIYIYMNISRKKINCRECTEYIIIHPTFKFVAMVSWVFFFFFLYSIDILDRGNWIVIERPHWINRNFSSKTHHIDAFPLDCVRT